jgi:hypothetical protein
MSGQTLNRPFDESDDVELAIVERDTERPAGAIGLALWLLPRGVALIRRREFDRRYVPTVRPPSGWMEPAGLEPATFWLPARRSPN